MTKSEKLCVERAKNGKTKDGDERNVQGNGNERNEEYAQGK